MNKLKVLSATFIFLFIASALAETYVAQAWWCYACTGCRRCRWRPSPNTCNRVVSGQSGECSGDDDCTQDCVNDPPPPPPPVARTISGTIFETTDPSSCNNTAPLGVTGLTANAYNGTTPMGNTSAVAADGTYSITGLMSDQAFNSVAFNGSLSTPFTTYLPACVTDNSGSVTCNLSGTGAVANCSPANGLASQDMVVNMGFVRSFNDKWFSVLDADLYGGAITVDLGTTPLGGYTSNIINTETATGIGGFGFAGSAINTSSAAAGVTEYGGSAEDLSTASGANFEDKWLNRFSFIPPEGATTNVPGSNNFLAGRVYSVTVDEMNNILARRPDYSIVASNEGEKETAIVYATGGGTIHIDQPFTTDDPSRQVLLLVTDADVEIADDVQISPTSALTITSPAQVDLNIISAGDISTGSRFDPNAGAIDNPLVINGTLIAKGSLNLDRNLGSTDNPSYPGETIRLYPYLNALIQKYELQYGTTGPYTGLTFYDVQFDYNQ